MSIKDIIKGKKEWKAHRLRVKKLPKDYVIVYEEIQKYLYKVGPVELNDGIDMFVGIVELFEEGVAEGKNVLDVTGTDVAAFCDELIKDCTTFADTINEAVSAEVSKAMKKAAEKMK